MPISASFGKFGALPLSPGLLSVIWAVMLLSCTGPAQGSPFPWDVSVTLWEARLLQAPSCKWHVNVAPRGHGKALKGSELPQGQGGLCNVFGGLLLSCHLQALSLGDLQIISQQANQRNELTKPNSSPSFTGLNCARDRFLQPTARALSQGSLNQSHTPRNMV